MELNRSSFGLYLKCIIALLGTNIWVFITLFVCTYYKVNSLSMVPPVLFGTISNIRETRGDNDFARRFGHVMFVETLITSVAGHVIIPLCAYRF